MTNEGIKVGLDMARLCRSVLLEKKLKPDYLEQLDLDKLLRVCEYHCLTAMVCMALEYNGITPDAKWAEARAKSIRKNMLLDAERAQITAFLEQEHIWYMPLKGSVLKDLYPKIGMRQMADNDILFDASRSNDVRMIMEDLGFTLEGSFGISVHDHYNKPPVLNFEMHRALFGVSHDRSIVEYYQNVKNRLIRDEGSQYGYHFTDEDFYIYVIAHEYKHYKGSGTGLRSLLDTYVYCNAKWNTLDHEYLDAEFEKLGVKDFEAQNRSLAMHLFGLETLTAEDEKMLDFMLSAGTYGTTETRVANGIEKFEGKGFGKVRYLLRRVFLPLDQVREWFPLFIKIPILLPFLPLFRGVRGLIRRRKQLKVEWDAVMQYKKKG